MANFTDLFNFNTTIIFDDYEQGQVKDLIGRLAPVLKREGTMYQGKTKQFYVVKAV
jgi:hypothetical protein